VDVQRQPRRAVQVGDHLWTEREVRDEVTVHHVDVDPVGTGPLGRQHRVGKPAEVGGQDRRSELQFNSSELSP